MGEKKPNKFSGTKERLDWFKIDSDAAKISTTQNYKNTKINVNGSTYIQQY